MLFIFEIEMFSFSSISRDYISLQAPCQTFIDRPVWLESSISRSLASDVQIYFIYLMCHTALLFFMFIVFCVLQSIVNYDQSERVMKFNGLDRSKFWEDRNVDISISSKKIKIMLPGNYSQYRVVYIQNRNVFVFFHIQGLRIFINTLSDCRRSIRPFRIIDSSFSGLELHGFQENQFRSFRFPN
jgi:hypothetical protein